jgi:hypothetical protein
VRCPVTDGRADEKATASKSADETPLLRESVQSPYRQPARRPTDAIAGAATMHLPLVVLAALMIAIILLALRDAPR